MVECRLGNLTTIQKCVTSMTPKLQVNLYLWWALGSSHCHHKYTGQLLHCFTLFFFWHVALSIYNPHKYFCDFRRGKTSGTSVQACSSWTSSNCLTELAFRFDFMVWGYFLSSPPIDYSVFSSLVLLASCLCGIDFFTTQQPQEQVQVRWNSTLLTIVCNLLFLLL